MTYRNYLIKNNPTSSYLLRIKIPKDLRYYFDGKIGFTMSVSQVSDEVLYTGLIQMQELPAL